MGKEPDLVTYMVQFSCRVPVTMLLSESSVGENHVLGEPMQMNYMLYDELIGRASRGETGEGEKVDRLGESDNNGEDRVLALRSR